MVGQSEKTNLHYSCKTRRSEGTTEPFLHFTPVGLGLRYKSGSMCNAEKIRHSLSCIPNANHFSRADSQIILNRQLYVFSLHLFRTST